MTELAGLSGRLISSVLVVGGLAYGGCLPTDDLAEYSEDWPGTFGGSGGSGVELPSENDQLGGPDASLPGMPPSDGGPMLVDVDQGGLGGSSSTPSGGDDAGLDAAVTGPTDAGDPAVLPDACADAAPGSGCGG